MDRSQPVSTLVEALAGPVSALAELWNGYEVRGAENIPAMGPALFVLYHGFMPIDAWYLGAHLYHTRGKLLRGLGDRWLFATPGLSRFVREVGAIPGTRAEAVAMLQAGEWVLVSPGGTREALTGRARQYRLWWGDRVGFAEVALAANTPLIPVFTENIEEAYRSPGVEARPIQALYEATRWPIVPLVGMGLAPIPVKLVTWLGAPVYPRQGESAEQLKARIHSALQALMEAHVHPRPRILRALAARARPLHPPRDL